MLGQYGALYQREQWPAILTAHGAGLLALLWLLRFTPTPLPPPPDAPTPPPARGPRLLALLLCVILEGVAWRFLEGNRFTLIGTSAWLGSVLLFLLAFWQGEVTLPRPSAALRQRVGRWLMSREVWAVALVLLLALAARLYRLESVPPEMNSDHVEKLLDVNDVLNGRHYIFFERNTGREPMQFYLVAAIIRLLDTGLSFYSLKLSNVLMGVLSVLGTYLLGREAGGRRVGWLAAFFVAVALWPVGTSRIGLRYPFAPAFTSLSLWLLWRALRTGQRNDWLLAGLMLGLGLHGYTSFRIMPLVVAATVGVRLLVAPPPGWRGWWRLAQNLVLCAGVMLLLFLPLGRYMTEWPDRFWYRSLTRSTDLEQPLAGPLWQVAGQTVARTVGMFNWVGDRVFVSTIPNVPVLDAISAAFFLVGLGWGLVALVRGGPSRWVAAATLVGGFLLLLPSALNFAFPLESPSVVRTGGAIPLVALLFALGVRAIVEQGRAAWPGRWGRRGVTVGVALLLLSMGFINYQRYFGPYVTIYRSLAMNTGEVSATLRDYLSVVGDTDHMMVKGWPHWVDTRALAIQLGDVGWEQRRSSMQLLPLVGVAPEDGQALLFLLHPADSLSLKTLQKHYPTGWPITFRSPTPHRDYILFIVPGTHPATYE